MSKIISKSLVINFEDKFLVCLHGEYNFVETLRKFIIPKHSIRKLGSQDYILNFENVLKMQCG